jgi:hypothetical protein
MNNNDEHTRFRNTDPQTSVDAGLDLDANKIMLTMTTLLDHQPEGYTCTELEALTGIKRDTLTPRISTLREAKKIVRTNLTRRYGDRPGETMRPGQHRHCTVYKSTAFATPEEIVPIPPPSLLGKIIMLATNKKYLRAEATEHGWTGTIESLGITVHGKYQGDLRTAAKEEVRRIFRPHFTSGDELETREDQEDWGDTPETPSQGIIRECNFYVITSVGYRICKMPTQPDRRYCAEHEQKLRDFTAS